MTHPALSNPNYVLHWEDFHKGLSFEFGARTVTQEEIIAFGKQFDPQPFHIDPVAAKNSVAGGLIASGWHTGGLLMRMLCDAYLLRSASMGAPGVEEIRWLAPVRPGYILRLRFSCLQTRLSSSRPDMGLIQQRLELFTPKDDVVRITSLGWGMFRVRNPKLAAA